MLRILCVDDHQVVCDGVRRLFEEKGLKVELGEANNAADATLLASRQDWDMAVLDISLGGGKSGLEVLKEIR